MAPKTRPNVSSRCLVFWKECGMSLGLSNEKWSEMMSHILRRRKRNGPEFATGVPDNQGDAVIRRRGVGLSEFSATPHFQKLLLEYANHQNS